MTSRAGEPTSIRPFDRRFFTSDEFATRIGDGALGGKAAGLIRAHGILSSVPRFEGIDLRIPRMVVVTTAVFDKFMERNQLTEIAHDDAPDDRKAHAFQKADLPVEVLGDLRALVEEVRTPLAVRSSSMLEDALAHPFAGVYATKMTPNSAHDPSERFARLVEAIKFVYASTFFCSPRRYLRAILREPDEEKMAVIVQEVVGRRRGDRFYPEVSGVARSWNFYPGPGARPEDGVVSLALGLGKTIVDGGVAWTISPLRPEAPPPFASVADRAKNTQTRFWAVQMGRVEHDPVAETEYLTEAGIPEAELDGSLRHVASTWQAGSDRLHPGTGGKGPRILDFAPLLVLRQAPLNDLVIELLKACERDRGDAVEIEFAMTMDPGERPPARFRLLQVRAMASARERVEVTDQAMVGPNVLLASTTSMGNGEDRSIRDVVYVRPERFEPQHTRRVAEEVERLDAILSTEGRPYLLIGFGRWGSADPWLGVPVRWDQIGGARVIVEAMLPQMNVEPSQGAHFFQNVAGLGVKYLAVRHDARPGIDWGWLDSQVETTSTSLLRHVRLNAPLHVAVDGRTGRAIVERPD